MLPVELELTSSSFTDKEIITRLFGPRLISCRFEILKIDRSLSSDQCRVCPVLGTDRVLSIKLKCTATVSDLPMYTLLRY